MSYNVNTVVAASNGMPSYTVGNMTWAQSQAAMSALTTAKQTTTSQQTFSAPYSAGSDVAGLIQAHASAALPQSLPVPLVNPQHETFMGQNVPRSDTQVNPTGVSQVDTVTNIERTLESLGIKLSMRQKELLGIGAVVATTALGTIALAKSSHKATHHKRPHKATHHKRRG